MTADVRSVYQQVGASLIDGPLCRNRTEIHLSCIAAAVTGIAVQDAPRHNAANMLKSTAS